jgi:2-polyprenyl-6-methoxyphenol hydroxylase-like FAD-dependent oxidoreductase
VSGPAPVVAERRAPDGPPEVAVVGAGPVGLSLVLGLARCGVRTLLLERDEQLSEHSKAPGVHVRTREVLRQWGVDDALLRDGQLVRRLALHRGRAGRRRPLLDVDFGELEPEAAAPGLLVLEQHRLERLLLEAVVATGRCDVRLGAQVSSVERLASGARVGYCERGVQRQVDVPFVVGCDGAGSVVREQLGLGFGGLTYALRPLLADVVVADDRDRQPWPQVRLHRGRVMFAVRLRPGRWRVVVLRRGGPPAEAEVSDREVREAVEVLLGAGPTETVWSSRFRIHRRSAPRFRAGPVLLAGDAAHVHSPVGGQGMNSGVHDAADLAWKLARALRGGDRERLLDSYDVERRAVVVGSTSRYTDLVTRAFLLPPGPVVAAGFVLLRQALRLRSVRRRAVRRAAMLDLRLPPSPLLPSGDRLAGVRLPDALLRAPSGEAVRLHELLGYRPAVVVVRRPNGRWGGAAGEPTGRHLPVGECRVHVERAGVLRRLLGRRDGWLLVRPDGHVACSGRGRGGPAPEQLRRALG